MMGMEMDERDYTNDNDLSEAIRHATEVADREVCTECGRQHRQLASWLTELQKTRAEIELERTARQQTEQLLHKQAETIAAEQAYSSKLRSAFFELWSITNRDALDGRTCAKFNQISFIPRSDTSALEVMIAKAGEKMRERCVEYMLLDRKALDSNKAVWAANPNLTPEDDYISEWEDKARAGEFDADAIRALPGVTLEDLK